MVSIWPERGPERGANMEELNFKAAVGHGRRGLLALLLVLICLWSVAGTAASQNARRVCSKCGGPVNVSSSFDGNHLLCSKCASSAPMCSVCGNKIEGVYCKSSTGECICQQCYNKKAPRCSSCGRLIPLGEHCITYEDGAFVCDYCSKDSELPHCFICHRPIAEGGLIFSDGRRSCQEHSKNPVNDQRQLDMYFAKAKELITKCVSPKINVERAHPVPYIVDQPTIERRHVEQVKLMGKQSDEPSLLGLTLTNKAGTGSGWQCQHRVYILQGLPAEDCLTVMVHELGHVWQNDNTNFLRLTLRQREGFAEWVAYKVNKALHRQDQINSMLNKSRNPKLSDYSMGLRDYLNLESRYGVDGVLRYALGEDPAK